METKLTVQGITRGTRNFTDDRAAFIQQHIHKRRLTDVLLTGNGQTNTFKVIVFGCAFLNLFRNAVQKIATAPPLHGGNNARLAQSETIEVCAFSLKTFVIYFVHRNNNRGPAAAQHARDILVGFSNSREGIHHK